jgi:hypothetical protein
MEKDKTLAGRFQSDRIRAFESAADQRFSEAELLGKHGHNLIAIYLYGYVVEILCKAACYRFDGKGIRDEIDEAYRKQVALKAQSYNITIHGPHDLVGWARLLVERKKHIRPDCDRELLQHVESNAEVVYKHWRPEMRYRATQAIDPQLQDVRAATLWIHSNYERIIGR